ncbi:hypothetical protein ACIP27_07280 [Streptomyces hydrogenans]|uniref:hypothetical protein n=1 Tax=Streptomyces hydrogenans TaxID=1873719 RepID=UPI0037FE7F8F
MDHGAPFQGGERAQAGVPHGAAVPDVEGVDASGEREDVDDAVLADGDRRVARTGQRPPPQGGSGAQREGPHAGVGRHDELAVVDRR